MSFQINNSSNSLNIYETSYEGSENVKNLERTVDVFTANINPKTVSKEISLSVCNWANRKCIKIKFDIEKAKGSDLKKLILEKWPQHSTTEMRLMVCGRALNDETEAKSFKDEFNRMVERNSQLILLCVPKNESSDQTSASTHVSSISPKETHSQKVENLHLTPTSEQPYANNAIDLKNSSRSEVDVLFEDLVQKTKQCIYFTEPVIQGDPNFNKYSRKIFVGKDKNKQQLIFFKAPYSKNYDDQTYCLKFDQLSFQISQALKLNVVPTTKVIAIKDVFSYEVNLRSPKAVVQSAVATCPTQFHLNENDREKLMDLDLNQVHKAIIFNMIAGRGDCRRSNSVIDENMRILEIDNEHIGYRSTSTWLLDAFKETTLDKSFVDSFLLFDKKIILDVFTDMSNQGFVIEKEVAANIVYNFEKIHRFFLDNREEKIQISQLKNINI